MAWPCPGVRLWFRSLQGSVEWRPAQRVRQDRAGLEGQNPFLSGLFRFVMPYPQLTSKGRENVIIENKNLPAFIAAHLNFCFITHDVQLQWTLTMLYLQVKGNFSSISISIHLLQTVEPGNKRWSWSTEEELETF